MKRIATPVCLLSAFVLHLSASAQVPQLINYQGRLLSGTNLVNGNVGLSLRLFNVPGGGSSIYEDSNTVTVADGLYSTFIGDNTTSGSLTNALTNAVVHVEVAVNGVALSPRERVVSVAYAMGSRTADGVAANAITSSMLATGAVQGVHLASSAVSSGNIADGTITAADIADNSITGAKMLSNTFWQTTGNTGMLAGTHFLGTMDAEPFQIRVNNQAAFSASPGFGAPNAVIGAGDNVIAAQVTRSVIAGGTANLITNFASASFIGGAVNGRIAGGQFNAIVGGSSGSMSNGVLNSFMGGGSDNMLGPAVTNSATVAGENNATFTGRNSVVVGGSLNILDGRDTVIAGGFSHTLARGVDRTFVGGGIGHSLSGGSANFIGGGQGHQVTNGAVNNFIGGGEGHALATGAGFSAVAGGRNHSMGAQNGFIGGGQAHASHGPFSAIVSGTDNAISNTADRSFIGGGANNTMMGSRSVIAGGVGNVISNGVLSGFIGGGDLNSMALTSTASVVVGGLNNRMRADYSAIVGGHALVLMGTRSALVGGNQNVITNGASNGFVGGGSLNSIGEGYGDFIAGGLANGISNGTLNSFIGGGIGNFVGTNRESSAVLGGLNNRMLSDYSAIIGGEGHTMRADRSLIAGGRDNLAMGTRSAIVAGYLNVITNGANGSVIAGGTANSINSGLDDFIGGGSGNEMQFNVQESSILGGQSGVMESNVSFSVIAGGSTHLIRTGVQYGAVGGGFSNRIIGAAGSVPGGSFNTAANSSMAAGRRAKATNDGTFVWADRTEADFGSATSNQFLIRASGGVGIGTHITPDMLTVAGNVTVTGRITAAVFAGDGSQITGISAQVSAQSVSNIHLAANAVSGDKIFDGTISNADLSVQVLSNTFWRLDGNAGTTPGTHFIGTTDNQPVEIRVDNLRALLVQPANGAPVVVLGAAQNVVSNGTRGAVIGGGSNNTIASGSDFATIGGGADNVIVRSNVYAVVAGGSHNIASNKYVFIGGGSNNTAGGFVSVIAGGLRNVIANSPGAFIGGGWDNNIESNSTIGTICGGNDNLIESNSTGSAISGGWNNRIHERGVGSVIGGGGVFFGGGGSFTVNGNDLYASAGVIGGGLGNVIHTGAHFASVGGGLQNVIASNSLFAVIPGGRENDVGASATNAFAAGRQAQANHRGVFVWADDTNVNFASTAPNQFLIRASGGVGIGTTNPVSALDVAGTITASAATLDAGGLAVGTTQLVVTVAGRVGIGTNNPSSELHVKSFQSDAEISIQSGDPGSHRWTLQSSGTNTAGLEASFQVIDRTAGSSRFVILTNGFVGIGTSAPTNRLQVAGTVQATAYITGSDRSTKEDLTPVSPDEILAKVAALPIATWKFKDDSSGRHLGPMAQDFHAAFGLGNTDRGIFSVDADGVALAAIQALAAADGEQKSEIRGQREQITRLEAANAELREQLEQLRREVRGILVK